MLDLVKSIKSKNNTCTDKHTKHSYIQSFYSYMFAALKTKPINLLEIGLCVGDSTKIWDMYFTHKNTNIFSFDNKEDRYNGALEQYTYTDRVYLNVLHHKNLLETKTNNNKLFHETIINTQYNIIIDDASHNYLDQQISYNFSLTNLKNGGILIIEDVRPKNVNKLLALDERLFVVDLTNQRKKIRDNILICMIA